MRRYEYPKISAGASVEVQLEEIKIYLQRLVDMLNLNQEGSTAFCLFKEALTSIKESELSEDNIQNSPVARQLSAVVVSLVAAVLEIKKPYFIEEGGEMKQTGLVNTAGGMFSVGEIISKLEALEKEIRKMKGD